MLSKVLLTQYERTVIRVYLVLMLSRTAKKSCNKYRAYTRVCQLCCGLLCCGLKSQLVEQGT